MKNAANRTKLLRQLHAYVKEKYELDDPHPLLHQIAVATFDVESMAHLSEKELVMLFNKIEINEVEWKKIEDLGVTRIPQMSEKQKSLVKKLQKELGWSDEYMYELTIRRYGLLDWQYLTGREAFAFVRYLIYRKKSKKYKKETVAA